MTDIERSDVTSLTVELLSAYLSNNIVSPAELVDLIRSTRSVLSEPDAPIEAEPEPEVHTPAVSARKSVANPDHIISLIDGKPYKALKRHLAGHGLTPQTYRDRYNLPANYPMVAPAFAERRREIAAAIGLGRRPKVDAGAAQIEAAKPSKAAAAPKKPAASKAAPRQAKAKAPSNTTAETLSDVPQTAAAEGAANDQRRTAKPAKTKKGAQQPPSDAPTQTAGAPLADVGAAKPARRMARPKAKA